MKIALFSDVHADEAGWRLLIHHTEFNGADKRICLGDVINAHEPRGAEKFFDTVANACDEIIMGNHEAVLVGECSVNIFGAHIRESIEAAKVILKDTAPLFLKRLSGLPRDISLDGVTATHASFNPDKRWHHVRYTEDVQAEAAFVPARVSFLAHGHIPFIAWEADGLWYYQRQIYQQAFKLLSDTTYVINTGSVLGSREMRSHERTFLVYDTEATEVCFYNLGQS